VSPHRSHQQAAAATHYHTLANSQLPCLEPSQNTKLSKKMCTKALTKYKRPLMTSQLHCLWCFFFLASTELRAEIKFQGTKITINGVPMMPSKEVRT
jgi:hypothetical protein